MADEFKIVASLNIPESASRINKDIPKLEGQAKHLKIVADLNPTLSIKNIQATLNKMNNNANIKIGVDASGLNSVQGATQNITNGLKNVQIQAQQTASAVKQVGTSLLSLKAEKLRNLTFDIGSDKNGDFSFQKTLDNAREAINQIGKFKSIKFNWNLDKDTGEIKSLTATIQDSQGVVQNYIYSLKELGYAFSYVSGSGTDKGMEKMLISMQKAQDKLKALRTDLASTLKAVGNGYSDPNAVKPIVDDTHLKNLNTQYVHALRSIADLKNADDTTMASMKANAESEIEKLKQMVKQYQNAEYAATSLRTKDIGTIKTNQINELNEFIAQVNRSKVPIDTMTKDIEELKIALNGIGDKDSLTKFLNQFDNAKSKFESVKATYQSIADKIKELQRIQNSGTFNKNSSDSTVINIKQQITALLTEYEKLKTQLNGNVTPQGLTDIGNKLTQLNIQFNNATTTAKRFETELRNGNSAEQLAQKVALLTSRIKAYRQANSKSEKLFGGQYDSMLSQLANPNIDLNAYNALNKQFQKMRQEINAANVAGKNLWQTFKEKLGKFTGWMSMTYAVSMFTRSIREALTELKEVDTVLTEISKANDKLTDSQLAQIGSNSFGIASKYGKTATDYLTGVQEMSRAGYANAEAMGELSTAAQGAGDMTADVANQFIIAADKAYKMNGSVEELTKTLDGINYITNNNAVNMSELSEGFSIVSSTAASFGVRADELTAALGTMAATTQQSGSEVARAFRAILLNIRQVSDKWLLSSNQFAPYVQKCA